MENDWKLFYSTNKMYKVNIIKEVLSEKNIKVHEIAKNQTGLPIGDIELYVLEENLEIAKEIIIVEDGAKQVQENGIKLNDSAMSLSAMAESFMEMMKKFKV